ncbi:MAG: hypothetical protein VYD19_06785, partial [Myxococcota bacterium]|nr:hypothetical protein [Myxococcota bacterium]
DGRPVWGHQIVMTFNGDQLITLNTDLGPAPKLKPATKSAHTLVELARRRFSKAGRVLPQDPTWGIHLTPTEAIEAVELPALSLAEGPIRLRLDGQSGTLLAKVRLSRDLRGLHRGPHQHRLKSPQRASKLPFIQKRPALKAGEGGESR